ncbi:hypothetical protein [Zoogloea sp.]|uniref:hypothetical protein n=1 Tax=Zoogloea sp. TaxID=49181 RepID=UPI0035AE9463
MSRHSILPGQPVTALFLLHVGSMDARLIGLSVERHWKHSVRLAADLESARVVLVDCDRPGVEAAFARLAPHPRIGVVCYAFHPKDHAQRFPNRVILGKPLNLEALPGLLAKAAHDSARTIAVPPIRRSAPLTQPAPPTIQPAPETSSPPITVATAMNRTPPPVMTPPAATGASDAQTIQPDVPAAAPPSEPPGSLGHGVQTDDERDLCGALEDLPPHPIYPLPEKIFFNPDNYLIGHLQRAFDQATSSGRPHLIAGLPRLIGVRVQPVSICVTDFRDNQLRPLSMAQLPQTTARIVGASTLSHISNHGSTWTTEDFFWNVAAWAARGRLPDGVDPYQPVRLRAWPNFTKVFMSPHALRIVALWVRTWASPIDIAARLGIPQRYVFSVYASARFAGLLDTKAPQTSPITERTTVTAPPAPQAPPQPQAQQQQQQRPSILSRILRKLLNAV